MRELRIIEDIRKRAGRPGKAVKIGIGDDCAVIDHNNKEYLLWATDMLIEGTHFKKGDPYKSIGRKALSVNISDIASMGGVPKYITVNLGIPKGMKDANIKSIYDGIFDVCKKYKIDLVGGDTNRSNKLIIDISIMGIVDKKHLLTRSAAKINEVIVITGPVRNGKKEHLRFKPRLEEARFIATKYKVGAMIDVSDGIALDISRICNESKVGCVVDVDAIPLSKGLTLKDALYYGESFELMFTMPLKEAKRLFKDMEKNKKFNFFQIGSTVSKKDGLKLTNKHGHLKKLEPKGYNHL